jgi:hypothetical protein
VTTGSSGAALAGRMETRIETRNRRQVFFIARTFQRFSVTELLVNDCLEEAPAFTSLCDSVTNTKRSR